MRSYELVTIFPIEEDVFKPAKEAVAAELKNQGAEIIKEDDMGERQLAFPIKKRPRGHYFLFSVNMPSDRLIHAEKVFKLNPNVLKYLFVRVET